MKYFPNSRILLPDNSLIRANPLDHYRTCDECVEEVHMIRRALFESPAEQLSRAGNPGGDLAQVRASSASSEATPECERHSNSSVTKYATRVGSFVADLALTLDHVSNAASDDNLCPVCGVDLLKLYVAHVKHEGRELSHADYEQYKEAHISDCLVAYDFGLNHQRLGSPPGMSPTRNRMLVYNIPPIPKPSYEIIGSGEDGQNGDGKTEQLCGLVNSSTTVQLEKHVTDTECVICLEDLKPGDKVGRLECLCVFHYKCIKDWFNKKGYGECPVHYLHH